MNFFVTSNVFIFRLAMAWLKFLLIVAPLLFHLTGGRLQCSHFYRWEKTNKISFCPNECKNHSLTRDQDRCCSCDAVSERICNSNFTSVELYLDYMDIKGKNRVLYDVSASSDVIRISHVGGYMSDIPVNICDFPRTVEIDFSYNDIRKLGNISCLVNLDTILLTHNKIKVVRNFTFLNLRKLWMVDLSHNRITSFEHGTLSNAGSGINYMILHNNNLSSFDAIDIVLETPFCKTDLSGNQITKITNKNEWVVNTNITYGSGGRVDFKGNQFTEFLDFEDLGFKDLTLLGKLFGFTFEFKDAMFPCDCKMQPFLALSEEVLSLEDRDIYKLRCSSGEMKDEFIDDLVRNKSLDKFVCEIKRICPRSCICFEQPSKNRTIVNCSKRNLTKIPSQLPRHHNLDIDLSGNYIRKIDNAHYFSNISKIDFSDNDILNIPSSFVNKIPKNEINITFVGNNRIRELPRNIQSLDPCIFQLGNMTLDCSCKTIWVKQWLLIKGEGKCNMYLKCNFGQNQKMNITEITEDLLECNNNFQYKYVAIICMIVASIIIGGVAIVTNLYGSELYLIWRNIRQTNQRKHSEGIRFDAYISLDEDDFELLSWVIQQLIPSLEGRGYNIFLPCRDLDPGSVREEAMGEILMQTNNYIISLSSDYFNFEQPWTNVEWRMTWNLYTRFIEKKIIVINYGQIQACTLSNSVAKAFLRFGLSIDFSNRKHELMSEIRQQLGSPIERQRHRSESAKPLFRPETITSKI